MTQSDQADPVAQTQPRDFSDWAVLRGAVSAGIAAYLLLMIAAPAALAPNLASNPAFLLERLGNALDPISLYVAVIFMCPVVIVGVAFLANWKGDHTTYRAAAGAGVCTGALAVALMVGLLMLPPIIGFLLTGAVGFPISNISAVLYALWFTIVIMAIGAASGLVGRWAAGAPKLPLDQ